MTANTSNIESTIETLLGNLVSEDLVMVRPEVFMIEQNRDQFKSHYVEYLKQERYKSCKIGFPYLVLGKRYEIGSWIDSFLTGFPCPVTYFYYFDLASEIKPSKWSVNFPEILEQPDLYVRCSKSTDWNDFLASIWDFNRVNVHVRLLNTNAVLGHPKYQKIIQSLLFRGVTLGFHGSFQLKWWQTQNRFLRMFADWGVVDFWHTQAFEFNSKSYLFEKENKLKYLSYDSVK